MSAMVCAQTAALTLPTPARAMTTSVPRSFPQVKGTPLISVRGFPHGADQPFQFDVQRADGCDHLTHFLS